MANNLKIIVDGKDDVINVESFLSITKAALGLLKTLNGGSSWEVGKVSHNSPLSFEFVGQSDGASQAIIAMLDGVDTLERTGVKPAHFNNDALKYAKSMSKPLVNGLSSLRLETPNRKAMKVTSSLYRKAENAQGPEFYFAFSELEGYLQMLEISRGGESHGKMAIADPLTEKTTICKFSTDSPESIGSLITHKIRVFGNVKYNREHEPVSIDIKEYEPLDDVVSFDELTSHQFRLTGNIAAEELIRKTRDMDG